MGKQINTDVILFSQYPFADPRQKQLVKWLTTTVQAMIVRQEKRTKKVFVRILRDTPAIYMS
ncbi:MAG TPA: hypothetical protein VHM26_07125 [Chitinophagaceae bacterium]|jgi:hypothetical protein|nr:hypothetical protein [Chitinophagaceae bacterium]